MDSNGIYKVIAYVYYAKIDAKMGHPAKMVIIPKTC